MFYVWNIICNLEYRALIEYPEDRTKRGVLRIQIGRFRRYFVYSFVSSPIDIVAIEILAGSSLGSCYLNPCLRIYSISPILKLQNKISHLSFPGSRRVNADPDL